MGSAISSYFVDQIELTILTKDKWGENLTPTNITLPCYLKWKPRTVVDISGNDAIAAGTVYIEDRIIDFDNRIKINGKDYKILQINHAMAFNLQHLELVIQ
jgi:hypothetical protein